ncbi:MULTISPECIES: WbuC family cupin fold metalloprotein [Enterobacter cloacae complex]|uniref:WbuC family cupin fold metalloprotein n=1 Tax=Enterobacter cloacae complex TaxID=354276 RepID=UPI00066957A8|nr:MULTISPECIES: WbuC family cupin fold metalloprotein [Enterobacter cloacae complex]SSH46508.1 Tryptophan synthase subunit beta like protein [Klebsiella pneumoniae]HAS1007485.1 WbuC family cupin fold metalloprotein [Enterobacter cloacae]HAS1147600.1 WbuC family cupin fold metalloprotein [Enterobacter cloacae]HAS1179708.1 WbuC family cupin fold metalloprotein [Enterobacter cloacae]HAS1197504.1 WbuC family cupin fold metalloprotein [Enterobacter cloacae]
MRLIDTHQLEALYEQAGKSARLRAHLLLHNSHQEKVQRLLIALVQGSYVDPHFHELPHQWEMFVVMQGQVQVCLYGKDGEIINQFVAGENTAISVVEFSPGDIHSVECLSPRALMMEVKEGPFDPSFAKAFI